MTTKPDLSRVWAAGAPGGNVVDPDVTTPGKFDAGWQAEVPPFEHFNFLQKLFTQGLAYNNEQGINVYSADTDYPIGGYVKGSDLNTYRCVVANGPSSSVVDPVGDTGGTWTQISTAHSTLGLLTPTLTGNLRYSSILSGKNNTIDMGVGAIGLGDGVTICGGVSNQILAAFDGDCQAAFIGAVKKI